MDDNSSVSISLNTIFQRPIRTYRTAFRLHVDVLFTLLSLLLLVSYVAVRKDGGGTRMESDGKNAETSSVSEIFERGIEIVKDVSKTTYTIVSPTSRLRGGLKRAWRTSKRMKYHELRVRRDGLIIFFLFAAFRETMRTHPHRYAGRRCLYILCDGNRRVRRFERPRDNDAATPSGV